MVDPGIAPSPEAPEESYIMADPRHGDMSGAIADDLEGPKKLPMPIIKAHVIGGDGAVSNVAEVTGTALSVFKNSGALPPPVDPNGLSYMFEISGALRTNVDAYAANIDGNGHFFEPVVDLKDEGARDIIRQAMYEEQIYTSIQKGGYRLTAERVLKQLDPKDDDSDVILGIESITEEEVDVKIVELRHLMAMERQVLEFFFDNCCTDLSFAKLRRIMRQDLEVVGNAYWEILRNEDGEPAQISMVPATTVRLLPRNLSVEVARPVTRSVFVSDTKTDQRRFRKFIQVPNRYNSRNSVAGSPSPGIYFKQWGDPRIYSSLSGTPYETEEAMHLVEPKSRPATEIMHFKVHNSRTPYGIPRWISEIINIQGSRHAEQVNLMFFENKSVPPLAILVSGGTLAPQSVTRIRDYVKNELTGSRNFHKILIIEAESGGIADPSMTGHVRVEIKPLAQQSEAIFLEYQDRGRDSLGMVFRNPRIVRGDIRDFNKATASSALLFAEQQVYSPERKEFDWMMNREILPELGVRFWRFKSKGPDVTDPATLSVMLEAASKAGYLTIAELRRFAERVYGVNLPVIKNWTNETPLAMLRLHLDHLGEGGVTSLEEDMGAPPRQIPPPEVPPTAPVQADEDEA